jgi:hypothetical protein
VVLYYSQVTCPLYNLCKVYLSLETSTGKPVYCTGDHVQDKTALYGSRPGAVARRHTIEKKNMTLCWRKREGLG